MMTDSTFEPTDAEALRFRISELREHGRKLRNLSNFELLEPLGRLGACWQPGQTWHQRATVMLEGVFGAQAVERALAGLSAALHPQIIESELRRELGRADLLETWQPDEYQVGYVRAYPLGVVAHVLAGNVFLGGVIALAQSLLTRNATLLKLSREDSGFTQLFVEALRAIDQHNVIASCITLAYWDSGQDAFNEVLRREADAVVVWGGAAAIAAYPQARCRGPVIHYGPRLGIGLVLDGVDLPDALRSLAWDVALWEQRACSSPRVLLVEDANDLPQQVALGLNAALSKVRNRIPAKQLTLDDKAEVVGLREAAWWLRKADVLVEAESMDHTVIRLNEIPAEIPLGYRTVLVVPISGLEAVPKTLAAFRGFLQTAVLAASPERWPASVDMLARAGITQVAAAGASAARFLGLPHEGEFALRRLVRLVGVDLGIGPLVDPERDVAATSACGSALAKPQAGK